MKTLRGTGVALVTPFTSTFAIDFNALERLVSHCIEGGVEYLVVMGTTGENPVLSAQEKQDVLKAVVEAAGGRVPIVYGIGGNDTNAVVASLKNEDLTGVDAILSVSPYYNKPTQEGIYQHFKMVSENSPLPVILYNVPGRTGSNVTAATTLRIAHDFKNIVAVKEASGDLEQVMAIIKDRPEGFLVLSGDDNLSLPIIAAGGDGVISVSGQAFPAVFTEMIRQSLAGEMATARSLHYRLFTVTQLLFAQGNPGGVKAALDILEVIPPFMRQPLWPISNDLRQAIEAEIVKHAL
ncbi:MAG: 4-hydroxy-tetrahydrodipicolinate synthase [Bacteroidetes bacterium]|nr:MAG: 4-hydroxy-tetrahydrodipicolinate synthase [Bacteroidota bacterium]